uniref:Myosin XIX n=1 Tax=Ornithorhynchus anatinus TaxID=9258 RepID=A0A6I8ND96_ORNAN
MPRKVKDHQSNSAINGSSNPGTLPGDNLQAFLNDEGQLHLLDDLTKVNPVTPATVLKCLQVRYAAGVFYTTAGCTLVALNPFQHVPHLYSTTLMRLYHCTPLPQELPPHIFTVAEQTYRNIKSLSEPVNQSIIISGESGAGKTWTSRCLMKFYATVAASCVSQGGDATVERIERRVLDSNPIMEAFGNACTLRNNNSSRFGKYIQLHLDRDQQMTGASIQTYLLEKTRVAYQAPCERNFHIFYQIAKGASAEERLEWELPENADFCWLPNSSRTLTEDCFQVTRDAMLHLGIDCPAQNNIFKVARGRHSKGGECAGIWLGREFPHSLGQLGNRLPPAVGPGEEVWPWESGDPDSNPALPLICCVTLDVSLNFLGISVSTTAKWGFDTWSPSPSDSEPHGRRAPCPTQLYLPQQIAQCLAHIKPLATMTITS